MSDRCEELSGSRGPQGGHRFKGGAARRPFEPHSVGGLAAGMREASGIVPCATCPTGHTKAHRWWDGKRACVCGQRHATCWICSLMADLTGPHDEALLHICPATDEFRVMAAVAR